MKTLAKTVSEIYDQIDKAKQALEYFNEQATNDRGEFRDTTTVRSRLNAAKAHVTRAIEKAQTLK
ncbi:MAG: hypothetical protein G8345_00070 [Magnetococcales bacterium]|nr:hypothetical protein [Magnetococcales bacterium]NGZ25261.1 hypothetical protein [Magnetococcales bacterium]